jgi:hypothetical protein
MLSQQTSLTSVGELNLDGSDDASRLLSDNTNVSSALTATARVVLDVELDLLSFLERVELAGSQGRMVEENLAAIIGADETEPSIADEADYWPSCHGM